MLVPYEKVPRRGTRIVVSWWVVEFFFPSLGPGESLNYAELIRQN